MTIGELRDLVGAIPRTEDHREVKVWMPGSTISLNGHLWCGHHPIHGHVVLVEGNMS